MTARTTSKTSAAPAHSFIPWPAAATRSSAFGATLARARRTTRAKRAQGVLPRSSRRPLDGPPPEVQLELDAAARVCQTLAAEGKELRFGTGADGRVSVELTDSAGQEVDVIGTDGLFRLLQQQQS
ncbi:MAG TPA: hypothetical protein VHX66_15265 [Solirubrobacteraceae bacterium]|jgi:hypothetical protein|nr:hypothetical protein [Solirubrobacteraceae bacterium]